MAGQLIKQGEVLTISIPAANRDVGTSDRCAETVPDPLVEIGDVVAYLLFGGELSR